MQSFEKTEEGKLRIMKEETITTVNDFSREDIENQIKIMEDLIVRLEKEVEDHKQGIQNLKELLEKCEELKIGQSLIAEEAVAVIEP